MFTYLSHIKTLAVALLAAFCLSVGLASIGPIQDAGAASSVAQVSKKKPKPCKKGCSRGGGSSWWIEE